MTIARQQNGKCISGVMNNHATIEEFLEEMFSMQSVLRLYKENQLEFLGCQEC
jgi:hypothetical protein